ncbi:MAG: hypothetical protein CBARDCOR_5948, partial [uncultured Caballeronia sp.]
VVDRFARAPVAVYAAVFYAAVNKGSVGAPWDMKTVGRRVMAANLEKRRYHDYKDSRCVDKQPTRQ